MRRRDAVRDQNSTVIPKLRACARSIFSLPTGRGRDHTRHATRLWRCSTGSRCRRAKGGAVDRDGLTDGKNRSDELVARIGQFRFNKPIAS